MNLDAVRDLLLAADALGLECLAGDDGQIVIYTGLTFDPALTSGTFRDTVEWEPPPIRWYN